MNKILILLFLWSICFMAACSSNLPEVEVTPAETLEVQIPTQKMLNQQPQKKLRLLSNQPLRSLIPLKQQKHLLIHQLEILDWLPIGK